MHSYFGEEDFEDLEVERRTVPRGPVPGLMAEVLAEKPTTNPVFSVREFGLESLFLEGTGASYCTLHQVYRLRLQYQDTQVECESECVRCEHAPRRGAVFHLKPEMQAARKLLGELLKPTGVPRNTD